MSIRLTPFTPSRLCCGRSRRLGLEPVSHAGFGQQVAGADRVGFQLARVGAVLAGRKTYDDSNGFPGGAVGAPPVRAEIPAATTSPGHAARAGSGRVRGSSGRWG